MKLLLSFKLCPILNFANFFNWKTRRIRIFVSSKFLCFQFWREEKKLIGIDQIKQSKLCSFEFLLFHIDYLIRTWPRYLNSIEIKSSTNAVNSFNSGYLQSNPFRIRIYIYSEHRCIHKLNEINKNYCTKFIF